MTKPGAPLSAAVGILLAVSVSSPAWALDVKRLDALFTDFKDKPGCALGVYDRGKPILLRAWGLASLEHKAPVTPDSVFNVGSVSKQFAAISAMLLAERGVISLDDEIHKHLPELPDYGARVTVRNLIWHTSGIRNYQDILFMKGLSLRDPVTSDEVYVLLTSVRRTDFRPGERYRYSNSGYVLLVRLVERASGKSWARFAQENIFGPLGMSNSRIQDDANAVIPGLAYGYVSDSANGYKTAGGQVATVGDGGVITSVRDLARWDADFYQGKVWTPWVKAEMLKAGRLADGRPVEPSPGVRYAGGLNLGTQRGLAYLSHGGKDLGYLSMLTRYPEQGRSYALLCNSIFDIGAIHDAVADEAMQGYWREPAPPAAARRPAPPQAVADAPPEIAEAAVGTYYSAEVDARYRLERRGKTIGFVVGPHLVRPRDPVRWLGDDTLGMGRSQLKFRRDSAQRIVGFELDGFEFVRN